MMRKPLYAALFTVAASAALLTAGCGGVSTNGSTLRATPSSGPVVFGINPVALLNTGTYVEESGLTDATSATGYTTGAYQYTHTGNGPLPSEQFDSAGDPPLGFAPGIGVAVAPGSSVIFHAAISNGTNGTTGTVLPIVPASVVLTSPEDAALNLPFTFTSVVTGSAYPNGTYGTAAFALPFTTTGLHSLGVSVADTLGNTSKTFFQVPVIRPTDSGVEAQIMDANGVVVGATATITNPITGAVTQATSDANGSIILFAAPGAQTITVTGPTGSGEAGTDTETLVAGKLLNTVTASGTTSAYTITIAAATAAGKRRA